MFNILNVILVYSKICQTFYNKTVSDALKLFSKSSSGSCKVPHALPPQGSQELGPKNTTKGARAFPDRIPCQRSLLKKGDGRLLAFLVATGPAFPETSAPDACEQLFPVRGGTCPLAQMAQVENPDFSALHGEDLFFHKP